MFKETLKQEQPIAYQTLSHALQNKRLAHAYLFSGPSGTPKKECAYLLAQSMICEHSEADGFACETCSECERIAKDTFADMIVLDGTTTSIKKDDILKLQHQFMKTGLEHTGKKFYILDHAENATVDALNSLLKFLEEPGSDMVAILLVEQMDRLLPTIISRCQNVVFQPLTWQHCYQACKETMEPLDAYLLSKMIRNKKQMEDAYESEEYQHAVNVFRKFQEEFLVSPYYALLAIAQDGFEDKKKRNGKLSMQYFLEMLMTFYKDVLQKERLQEDEWYQKQIVAYNTRNFPVTKLLEVLLSTRDKLLRSVNIALLCDELVYEMKEAVK